MQQVEQYLTGERDYVKIYGGTGPLVYPAAHVYIYTALYWITDKGKDIRLAQGIFALLYLLTLGAVMACYRQAKVRNEIHDYDRTWLMSPVIGATICLPHAHSHQAPSQHICPQMFQRLLRRLLSMGGHLRLPKKSIHSRQPAVQLGLGDQDELAPCPACARRYLVPRKRSRYRTSSSLTNGTATGSHCDPICVCQPTKLSRQSIRVLEGISVQVDSQLALHG